MINSFEGEYRVFSNFYGGEDQPLDFTKCPIRINGLQYCCVEVPFHSFKTTDLEQRAAMQDWDARQAKAWGSELPRAGLVRSDWMDINLTVMERLLHIKFRAGSHLADILMNTGGKLLIEGNWWHDNFWGSCQKYCPRCVNKPRLNHLGRLLMKIRTDLQGGADNARQEA